MTNVKRKMNNNNERLKVAIVCDWLTTMGGAERVVLELHRMFPEAPIYTSSYSPERMPLFKDADVRTSFIQKLPFSHKHQLWPVLRRRYFSKLELDEYDLVVSSSGAEAKAVNMALSKTRKPSLNNSHLPFTNEPQTPNAKRQMTNGRKPLHINYCHSPTQYYWVRPEEYMSASTAGGVGFLDPVWRLGLKILKPWMKRWDYQAAQSPDYIVTNSGAVQKRAERYYDRESEVIWPPVDVEKFAVSEPKQREGFLIAGRQVHHKRFDLAVRACSELGLKLTVIGDGPEHKRLQEMAGPTVEFLGRVSDERLVEEFQSAQGYIFPQEDDFGIVAAEAMAAGTPVIAFRAGGSLDIVIEGETGIFFERQSVKSLKNALEDFKQMEWNYEEISKYATKFSTKNFVSSMKQAVERASK